MKTLAAIACALLSGCAWQAGPKPLLLAFTNGTCSGTAIAPHVILTATHCFENGIVKLSALIVKQRIDDGNDHTLLIVAADTGARAQIAPMPKPGAVVHMLGNPGDLRDLYAAGTVAGEYNGNTLLNLPIFYGDSGAAVMDAQGRIVGVISGVRVLADAGVIVQWGEAKPLRFTAAQWREAGL